LTETSSISEVELSGKAGRFNMCPIRLMAGKR